MKATTLRVATHLAPCSRCIGRVECFLSRQEITLCDIPEGAAQQLIEADRSLRGCHRWLGWLSLFSSGSLIRALGYLPTCKKVMES